MTTPLDITAVRQTLAHYSIPPRPEMLVQLQQALNAPEPELKQLAEIIHQDPGIASFTLKVVNSAYFGLPRKIASIDHACMFLGMQRVVKLVRSIALQATLSTKHSNRFTEKLWRSSNKVGAAAMLIARELGFDDEMADELFTAGLFHNAGILLILEQEPDYPELLQQAYQQSANTISDHETQHLKATHELLGFLLAQDWGLTHELSHVIAYHHSPLLILATGNDKEKQLLALLKLAEHLVGLPKELGHAEQDHEWQAYGDRLLRVLDIRHSQLPGFGERLDESMICNIYS